MTIHTTPSVDTVRCYRDGDHYDERAAYDGCAQITYIPPAVAVVTGMHGHFERHDLHELLHHIHSQGIAWVMAERAEGHALPWGRQVEQAGPFCGWWEIDLQELFAPPAAIGADIDTDVAAVTITGVAP